MKLTRIQKMGVAFFAFSLPLAFLIAQWRYEAALTSLNETLQKEHALHLSADKLLSNCEKSAALKADPYDATHQICKQGSDIHAHTEQVMAFIADEKAANEIKWYRNFGLTVLLLNLLAFALYRANIYLQRETD